MPHDLSLYEGVLGIAGSSFFPNVFCGSLVGLFERFLTEVLMTLIETFGSGLDIDLPRDLGFDRFEHQENLLYSPIGLIKFESVGGVPSCHCFL